MFFFYKEHFESWILLLSVLENVDLHIKKVCCRKFKDEIYFESTNVGDKESIPEADLATAKSNPEVEKVDEKSPFKATYTHRVQSNPFTSCEIASLLSEEVTELQAVASDFDERLWVSAAQVRLTEVLPARKKC